jgi:hypothetical protein
LSIHNHLIAPPCLVYIDWPQAGMATTGNVQLALQRPEL